MREPHERPQRRGWDRAGAGGVRRLLQPSAVLPAETGYSAIPAPRSPLPCRAVRGHPRPGKARRTATPKGQARASAPTRPAQPATSAGLGSKAAPPPARRGPSVAGAGGHRSLRDRARPEGREAPNPCTLITGLPLVGGQKFPRRHWSMLRSAHPIGSPARGGSKQHLHGGGQLFVVNRGGRCARVRVGAGWVGGWARAAEAALPPPASP